MSSILAPSVIVTTRLLNAAVFPEPLTISSSYISLFLSASLIVPSALCIVNSPATLDTVPIIVDMIDP